MSVLILNTMSDTCEEVSEIQREIWKKERGSEIIYTDYIKIAHCIGCNHCWLKTPGVCALKDDFEIILKKVLKHDKIIFVTDTRFGFISYKTKVLFDRLLPLATMYLQFVDGQMRHVERYDIHPQMGILYAGDGNKEYLDRWLERTALNFGGTSLGAYSLEQRREMVACI